MASQLLKATDAILVANQIDTEAARGKISEVMLIAFFLDQERIAGWYAKEFMLNRPARSDWGSAIRKSWKMV